MNAEAMRFILCPYMSPKRLYGCHGMNVDIPGFILCPAA